MHLDIRGALEVALAAFPTALPTAYENGVFIPPTDTNGPLPYQHCFFIAAPPTDPTIGSSMHMEQGILQISLMYPSGVGSGDSEAMGKALQLYFKRGNSYTFNGVTVHIGSTPAIGRGVPAGDRWMLPVSISYFSYVFS